jgi:2,4-dienoyl-CoA reductase-like NADH-dependent reductase (Old Yellow Enzyme family)/thioredoxin reductase
VTDAFPTLLSPLAVGSIEVRNRVVSTAHGAFLDFYRPGAPGDRYIAYQERRARGGTGLIILQPVHVHHTSQAIGHYTYDRDDLAPKLRQMADALHRRGARVLIQLLHFGGAFRSDANSDLEPLWGFGSFVSPTGSEAVHQMTPAEIEELVSAYVATATLAVECGLDGVELQASHGYLVQQSLSPWSNGRGDKWGRPTAFASAILDGIRASVGSEPVVGLRVSVDDWVRPEHGGVGPARMRELTSELAGDGRLDLVNVSAGARAAHYSRSIGSYRHPAGPLLELTAELREALDAALPVIGVSRILTPELAERALATRACDLVGMTRAQIADPDLVARLAAGDSARVRPCVGANQGCVDRQQGGLPITCFHNPEVGLEHRLAELEQSAEPRRVLVVGGGPAGIKAAEIAARAGHAVLLIERADRLGGALSWLRATRHPRELLRAVDWVAAELERLEVEVRLGTEVAADELRNGEFDAIVLATGALPAPERLAIGDGSVPVLGLTEALADGGRDRDLLVVDNLGTDAVSITAEALAATARSVTVISPMQSVGAHIGFTMIKDQLQRLYAVGCELEPSTALMRIDGGEVVTRHVHSGQVTTRRFDAIIAGVAGEPDLGLYDSAVQSGAQVLLAGDVVAPRTALHAFREGDRAGRAIGSPAILTAF